MGFFDAFKQTAVVSRKQDEHLYSLVAKELADNTRHDGLWIKALALADGNKDKQVSEYIKLRVQALKDEIYIFNKVNAEVVKKKNQQTKAKNRAKLGMRFDLATGEVLLVNPSYAAAKAGITHGDVILGVNHILLKDNYTQVKGCLENTEIFDFKFTINRDGEIIEILVSV